ncbi:MAG: fimbrillin family protein [Alloprevotella sp.]
MKQTVLLLVLSLLLAGCVSDDVAVTNGSKVSLKAEVLPRQTGASPKAVVGTGVVTTFEPGDVMGLFEVDENGAIVADNQRFMFQKTGGAFRVDDDDNVIASDIYWNPSHSYFAYCPYSSRYDGCHSVEEIIDRFKADYPTLYANQNSHADYRAADLMVCRTPQKDGMSLRFVFNHAMGQLRIFYNGEDSELVVEKPVKLDKMYRPEGGKTYSYIIPPQNNLEVYGTALSTHSAEGEEGDLTIYSYWQTHLDLVENGSLYLSIACRPTESYRTAGVDMGLPSGCIRANHNLGTENDSLQRERGGKWYDADGNVRTDLMESKLHACFDRGDYFSWGELDTKYERPALIFNSEGRITAAGETLDGDKVTPFVAGSKKGYYPGTYLDRNYTYANIDGNIAGTEYDVVRNRLWKGEWRIPNENEVDELMRNCNISVHDWYYEDNVRYAPRIAEKDAEGNYTNLHPDNSEFYGTAEVRPIRYLVVIYKFVSKINGEVIYFPGGTWSDWSIDMLACNSRTDLGVGSNPIGNHIDYGGMYYFASSASHDRIDCSSYMELECKKTYDGEGKITALTPVVKSSSYVNSSGETINLMGLTQDGHRYTGMLIRPVYGGRNWNTNATSRRRIFINVE